MKIKNMFKEKERLISFEIFPPNKNFTIEKIYKVIDELAKYNPNFISVTYGAAGNKNYNYTIEIASYIKNTYGIESMPHLTCITSTKEKINDIVQEAIDNNLKNILALRGDLPEDPDFDFPNPLQFEYASDLIKEIRKNHDLCISAACYPEGHIAAPSLEEDLKNLKYKVDMGVDFLISQLFFDNNYYYNMLEQFDKLGIDVPVMAGIMPVINAKQINKIVSLCGAKIPHTLERIIDKYGDDKESMYLAGVNYACEQINDIIAKTSSNIHLYVMNNPRIVKGIINNINL